jgi:hypothetical protein
MIACMVRRTLILCMEIDHAESTIRVGKNVITYRLPPGSRSIARRDGLRQLVHRSVGIYVSKDGRFRST